MGYFNAVTLDLKTGNIVASFASNKHRLETNANCITVNVAGISNAFNIDFEEVFVSADDVYHSRHST